MESIKIKQQFPNLGLRIIYAYIAAYPEFVAVSDNKEKIEAQRQMHAFLYDTLKLIYAHPELVNIKEQDDECYKNKEMSNSNPVLIDKMAKIESKLIDFYELLYKIGTAGTINNKIMTISKSSLNISKKTYQKLEKLGLQVIDDNLSFSLASKIYPELFSGLKQYIDLETGDLIKRKFITNFILGRHSKKTYSAVQMFGRLLKNPDLLGNLEEFFIQKGFICTNDMLSVTWVKQYPNKKKGIFAVRYYWRNEDPLSFEVQIPNFRTIFDQYEQLPDVWKNIIFSRTKTCNGCNYCTQMDKNHVRRRLAVLLRNGNITENKCPLYPDFSWYNLSFEETKTIQQLYQLSDSNLI